MCTVNVNINPSVVVKLTRGNYIYLHFQRYLCQLKQKNIIGTSVKFGRNCVHVMIKAMLYEKFKKTNGNQSHKYHKEYEIRSTCRMRCPGENISCQLTTLCKAGHSETFILVSGLFGNLHTCKRSIRKPSYFYIDVYFSCINLMFHCIKQYSIA